MEVDAPVTHVESIECRTFPIQRVTVFSDRAEVRRNGNVKLQTGNNEINIINLPGDIIDDSVRVSGTGEATIHEVQVAWKAATEREKDCPQAVELRQRVEIAEKELSIVQSKKKLVQKKREALDNLINKLGQTESARTLNFDSNSFGSIDTLFAYYDEKVLQLNETESVLQKEEREAQERLNVLREDLNRYVHPGAVKTVTVVLESAGEADVELLLAYQVYNANWRPAYDVRVENADEKKHMQITYSGRVTQNSGEEWSGCQLVLSTARPSVGGSLPELGTLDVSLYVKPEVPPCPQPMAFGAVACGAPMMMARSGRSIEKKSAKRMKIAEAEVEEQALSTEFVIARPAAIPPDGAEHKVTIGVASLTPVLQHECVPSKNNSVYLTASATNTSALPFLQGEAAIFLDGNFITKSPLKAVSPGEVFTVSLGVDASVRVDYKPAHNKQGEAGLINKTATAVREQKVTVKNTRREPVFVTVKENVPRSTDEKIKVKLVSPVAHYGDNEEGVHRKEGALINSSNNLEWTVAVQAGDKKELIVKWQVDYPGGEKLEYAEKSA